MLKSKPKHENRNCRWCAPGATLTLRRMIWARQPFDFIIHRNQSITSHPVPLWFFFACFSVQRGCRQSRTGGCLIPDDLACQLNKTSGFRHAADGFARAVVSGLWFPDSRFLIPVSRRWRPESSFKHRFERPLAACGLVRNSAGPVSK